MNDQNQSSFKLACHVAQLLDKKGGRGIFVYDVRGFSTITDFMLIVSGTSSRHMETLIDAPSDELKKLGFPARSIEGKDTHWIVADLNDVIVHVFDEGARQQFNLEDLWKECPRVEWDKPEAAVASAK